jgi:hypothetical protein
MVGWVLFVAALLNPIILKGGSSIHFIISGSCCVILVLGYLAYVIGRRSFLGHYGRAELAFVFAPYALGTLLTVGLVLSIVVYALAWNNVL